MADEKNDLEVALDALRVQEPQTDVVLYNGPIDDRGFWNLIRNTSPQIDRKVVLILVTSGGDPNAAFNIGRFLNSYGAFEIAVPSECKSAGTLVAIAAEKIYMSIIGELGPLDVQLMKRDELFQQQSGLVYKKGIETITTEAFRVYRSYLTGIKDHSKNTVSFALASKVAHELTSALFTPITSQIDPIVAGEFQRDLEVAQAYGKRLDERYGHNLKEDGLARLIHEYPSHDFVLENHAHAVALHFFHYNFIRIHKTLRVTPAMAAGVTDRLWDVTDLVRVIEEFEARQSPAILN